MEIVSKLRGFEKYGQNTPSVFLREPKIALNYKEVQKIRIHSILHE